MHPAQDEDDPGYHRLEVTNAPAFLSREMMTSPDDAFRFPYPSPRGSPSPASTPNRSAAASPAPPAGVNQALVDARLRGLALEQGLEGAAGLAAPSAADGPEVVEEACIVDSPTNARGHAAPEEAGEEEGEEEADSVPAELGSAGKGGKNAAIAAALGKPLGHEASLGGWNSSSLGDMLATASPGGAAGAHGEGEGEGGEAKEPATPEQGRSRPAEGADGPTAAAGGSGSGPAGAGGLGFTFSAPETASPPMLAAFGWSPNAHKARREGCSAVSRPLCARDGASSTHAHL